MKRSKNTCVFQYLLLLFLPLFILSCGQIQFPSKDYLTVIKFHTYIIDIEESGITSKDELLEELEKMAVITPDYRCCRDSNFFRHRLEVVVGLNASWEYPWYNDQTIFIKPLSNNKPVLDTGIFEYGTPIKLEWFLRSFRSRQQVILIRGNPEWADSSCNDFIVLPVANTGDDGILSFNWIFNIVE